MKKIRIQSFRIACWHLIKKINVCKIVTLQTYFQEFFKYFVKLWVRTVNYIWLYLKKLPRIENSLVAVLTRVSKIFFHNMYQYSFVPFLKYFFTIWINIHLFLSLCCWLTGFKIFVCYLSTLNTQKWDRIFFKVAYKFSYSWIITFFLQYNLFSKAIHKTYRILVVTDSSLLKFIYSEKATKFCEIFT